jgi:hypothetical protein
VLEITAITAAVKTTSELVKAVTALAGDIRSGLRVDNEGTKERLTTELEALQVKLGQIGDLAVVAERYSRLHGDVAVLLDHVIRAERMISDEADAFRSKSNPRYAANWRVIESMFATIEAARGPIVDAVFNRISWFNEIDRAQIQPHLSAFDSDFRAAQQAMKLKAANDARANLEAMARPLEAAERLTSVTLYEEIFPALQSIRSSGVAPA